MVEVIITTTGGVRDPVMIEEWPEGWGFGRAAIKAATSSSTTRGLSMA